MLIECISLLFDTERRKSIEKKINFNYFRINFFDAINGKNIPAIDFYYINHKRVINKLNYLTPSEIGASLSHISVLENFLASDEDYILILEDDVISNTEEINRIIELNYKINNSGVFICGGQDGMENSGWHKYLLGKEIGFNIYMLPKFSYRFVTRACAYIVNRRAAQEIINKHSVCLRLADDWNLFFKDTNIPVYYADIVKHPIDLNLQSNIEEERVMESLLFSKYKIIRWFQQGMLKKIYDRCFNDLMRVKLNFDGYKQIRKIKK